MTVCWSVVQGESGHWSVNYSGTQSLSWHNQILIGWYTLSVHKLFKQIILINNRNNLDILLFINSTFIVLSLKIPASLLDQSKLNDKDEKGSKIKLFLALRLLVLYVIEKLSDCLKKLGNPFLNFYVLCIIILLSFLKAKIFYTSILSTS